jgi:hypothetical protein
MKINKKEEMNTNMNHACRYTTRYPKIKLEDNFYVRTPSLLTPIVLIKKIERRNERYKCLIRRKRLRDELNDFKKKRFEF